MLKSYRNWRQQKQSEVRETLETLGQMSKEGRMHSKVLEAAFLNVSKRCIHRRKDSVFSLSTPSCKVAKDGLFMYIGPCIFKNCPFITTLKQEG